MGNHCYHVFYFMVYHIKEKNMSVYMLGLSMSSFFFGWLHEGITFPITLTLIIYCILNYHKHKIFKSPIFYCTVFYALGTFVCLSSPGTIQRIGQQDSLWQLMTQKSYLVELIYFIYVYHILCWLFLSFYSIRRELFGKSTSIVISIFTWHGFSHLYLYLAVEPPKQEWYSIQNSSLR